MERYFRYDYGSNSLIPVYRDKNGIEQPAIALPYPFGRDPGIFEWLQYQDEWYKHVISKIEPLIIQYAQQNPNAIQGINTLMGFINSIPAVRTNRSPAAILNNLQAQLNATRPYWYYRDADKGTAPNGGNLTRRNLVFSAPRESIFNTQWFGNQIIGISTNTIRVPENITPTTRLGGEAAIPETGRTIDTPYNSSISVNFTLASGVSSFISQMNDLIRSIRFYLLMVEFNLLGNPDQIIISSIRANGQTTLFDSFSPPLIAPNVPAQILPRGVNTFLIPLPFQNISNNFLSFSVTNTPASLPNSAWEIRFTLMPLILTAITS